MASQEEINQINSLIIKEYRFKEGEMILCLTPADYVFLRQYINNVEEFKQQISFMYFGNRLKRQVIDHMKLLFKNQPDEMAITLFKLAQQDMALGAQCEHWENLRILMENEDAFRKYSYDIRYFGIVKKSDY